MSGALGVGAVHAVKTPRGCPVTGCACLALTRLWQSLEDADRLARPASPDLDLEGEARLEGCAQGCCAWFRLSPDGVEIQATASAGRG